MVSRVYGGVKLGAGGLTRAYGNTAKAVIDAAEIVEYVELTIVKLTLEYKQVQMLEYQLKKLQGKIIAQDFNVQVNLTIELPLENKEKLLSMFS